MYKMCVMALAVAAGCGSAGAANLVVDGGFENPLVTSPTGWDLYGNGSPMGAWLAGGAGVILVGAFGGPSAIEGNQCVELNYYQGGSVQQNLATTSGQWYHLSFEMAGQYAAGPDLKTLHIYWGDTYLGQFAWDRSASHGQWESHGIDVLGTTDSTMLLIVGETDVDGGPYIDDVRVEPIPGPGGLAAAGALGLVFGRRRSRT